VTILKLKFKRDGRYLRYWVLDQNLTYITRRSGTLWDLRGIRLASIDYPDLFPDHALYIRGSVTNMDLNVAVHQFENNEELDSFLARLRNTLVDLSCFKRWFLDIEQTDDVLIFTFCSHMDLAAQEYVEEGEEI